MANGKKLTGAEWRGYAKAQLDRIPIIEKKLDSLFWKVAAISGVVTVLTSVVFNLVK